MSKRGRAEVIAAFEGVRESHRDLLDALAKRHEGDPEAYPIVRDVKRAPRVNECGHPERKHLARGMCNVCYQRERRRDAAWRDHLNAGTRARMSDPDRRARKNAANRERAASPEARARRREYFSAYKAGLDAVARARLDAARRERLVDPIARERINASARDRYARDPERKNAPARARYAARKCDPEYIDRKRAWQRAHLARKKEQAK
jgi:hypothetical protein